MSCAFSQNDAAFVLGALAPREHLEFEEHLAKCEECSKSVRDLAGMPGLLGKVSLHDVTVATEKTPSPPQSLLPALLTRVRGERRRRHLTSAGLAALAACLIAIAAVAFVTQNDGVANPSSPAVAALSMAPIGDAPVRATARLIDQPWGTRIDLRCTYLADYNSGHSSYALVVIDRNGLVQQVATWTAILDGESAVMGSSSWSSQDIAAIEIRTAAGAAVTRLDT
ncbi:MAG: zf-HC2 domain-containing protein [Candidatus Nanopelagicales bacterium]